MKYTEFDVEDYLNDIEDDNTEYLECDVMSLINDDDCEWIEKEEIDEDGLYVTNFDSYLYKIVYEGEVVFEMS